MAAGLAHDSETKRKPRIRVAILGACFMCCVAAACLTLGQAWIARRRFEAEEEEYN